MACRPMEPKPRWRRLLRLRCDKKLRGAGPAVPRVSARAAMREALGPTETFEPPPLPCGHCMLSLRMSDSNDGLEELNAELRFTNGEKAANLRGMYIFREENGDFLDCCARGPERLKDLAPVLFNEFGLPKEVLKKQCGVRARTGGFLWLVSLDVSEELELDIQKEFIQKVFCVLAGAMKRLTLVLCLHDSIDRVQHMDLHPMEIDGQQVFSWEKRSSDPKTMAMVASQERRLRPPEEPMEPIATTPAAVLPQPLEAPPAAPPDFPPEAPPLVEAPPAPETAPVAVPTAATAAPSNSTSTPSAPSNEMTQSSALISPAVPAANAPGTPNSMAGSMEEFSDVEGNTSVPASPGRDFRTRWRMKGKGSANRNEPPAAQSTSPPPSAAAPEAEPTKAVPAPAAPAPAAAAPAQASVVPKAGKAVEAKGKGKVKGKLKTPLAATTKRRSSDMEPPPLHAAMRRQRRVVSLESVRLEEPPLPEGALERTPSTSSLSQRMQWALLRSATCAQRMWAKQMQKLENGRAAVDIWLGDDLPEKFQAGVHKAFIRGMVEVASAVEHLLWQGKEPALATLHSAFPASMDGHYAAMQQRMLGLRVLQGRQRHSLSHFYGKGGRLEDVLRLLLVDAERFCQKQDASVQDVGEEPSSAWAERYGALPPRAGETWATLSAALGLDAGSDGDGDAKRRRVA